MNGFENWELYHDDEFIKQKELRRLDYIQYMFLRTHTMFDWKGLPKTIPTRIIEQLLQVGGNACIFRYEGELYATFGGLGGELDYNYEPTLYVIANPYLNYSAELKIGEECVRIRSDDCGKGLLPMYMKYASMMTENDISIVLASVLQRMRRGIVADNDVSYESAKEFIKNIYDGALAPIMSEEFFAGVHGIESEGGSENITDLIETQQYLKASWFNDVGLNSNYNMKRERIAAPEAQMTDDALLPLVDMMLECRRRGCEEVNEMFGTEWSVDLAGAWLREHMKQQVAGVDFDSDGDPEIDEESVEMTDDSDESDSDQIQQASDEGEETVDLTDEGGEMTDEADADDGDNAADGGDDGDGSDNTSSDDGDSDVDIDITIDIDTSGDNGDDEVKEDVEDDDGQTQTAD